MNTACFTFPSAGTGHAVWASSPSCRGTFEIISLCLTTTIICIWSSIHWDIPLRRVDADLPAIDGWSFKDIKGRLKRKFTLLSRSLLWHGPLVLVAIFCPELMLYNAIDQLLCARKLRKEFSKPLEEISHGKKEAVSSQSQRHDRRSVIVVMSRPHGFHGFTSSIFQDGIEMESGDQGGNTVTESQRDGSQVSY